jgi:hypothetical protein
MAQFRINDVPPGQAPEWVRKAWVDLVLPMRDVPPASVRQAGIFGGKSENLGGFAVSGQIALSLLKEHNSAAAEWWSTYAPHVLFGDLVFIRDVCEIVD